MDMDQYLDYLTQVQEDPTVLPDTAEAIEELILEVYSNLDLEDFMAKLPILILSLMLHQAAVQGAIEILAEDADREDAIFPQIH